MLRFARLHLAIDRVQHLPEHRRDLPAWIAEELALGSLSDGNQEVGWVLAFDNDRMVYTLVEVARGTARALPLHMPTIMATVLLSGSDRFHFIHSHPGLDPTPSAADLEVTEMLAEAAGVLGLYFEDHIVVTNDHTRYVSLKEAGLYVPPQHIETEAARYGSANL